MQQHKNRRNPRFRQPITENWRLATMPLVILVSIMFTIQATADRFEDFSVDPNWEGRGNRTAEEHARTVVQNFGYSRTNYAGGETIGEIGGRISRSLTPATYATGITTKTLNDPFTASGKFAVTEADGSSGMLIGWFNTDSSGWRTPNSLAFRLDGNGGKYWVFFEYGTQNYLTGSGATFQGERYQTTKTPPEQADGTVHTWSLTYDPSGAAGNGEITFLMDGNTYTVPLAPGHKADGATFNRFGMLNMQIAGKGMNVYLDDLSIDGKTYDFTDDPSWEENGNRVTFDDREIRPYHNFGWSETNHAGGTLGEIGGLIWRADERKPEQAGYYADQIGHLTMDNTLEAAGKVAMLRASADSAVLIGWFNSETYIGAPPKNFVGIMVEGPSRIGHYFRPVYANAKGQYEIMETGPVIKPSRISHRWRLAYVPDANNGHGQMIVTFNDETISLNLKPNVRADGAVFDRFGMLSFQRGGHFVDIYFDDISYTVQQK
ncbi:MAG: hypothetical protein OXL96_05575 [Candidatus Poribacteria bacterium]|nr:hypothetical protein [Candidatus Poribacteria bacterium]